MPTVLLATKFHIPPIPAQGVQRPALIQRLSAGFQAGCQLTLISAPAGFGKSTCASEWLRSLPAPTAWLSLDPADDDPARFFAYFQAALQKCSGTGGPDESAPDSLPAALDGWLNRLLNELEGWNQRGILVLDDFQVIRDPLILKMIERLLAVQPRPLHLVLITREDPPLPLARLRAHNRLVEIRAEDLRFSGSETSQFLNAGMGLGLSESDLATLSERTEGWVVGLQLAAIALRSASPAHPRPDPSGFIARLNGSHRYILSYLTEEVLDRQPEEIQAFLLQTSILDRLSGDLCDAVTGRSGSAALLERLLAANLFLVSLDDEQRWYRYHHLFADLLAGRLKLAHADQVAELHRRASRWFAQAHASSPFAGQAALASAAIEHALAAPDYPAAVQLIERHGVELTNQWYAKTVNTWMRALPAEWSAKSPRTNLAFARMHLMQLEVPQASAYLERMRGLFSGEAADPAARPYQAEWLALESSLANNQGNSAQAIELANQAIALLPAADLDTRSQAVLAIALAHQQLEHIPQAEAAFQALIQLGQQSGNILIELLGLSTLALLFIQRGRLRAGFELASQGVARAGQLGGLPPICAGLFGELGQVHFHWGQFEQAEAYFRLAAQSGGAGSFSDGGIFNAVASSRRFQIAGDWEAAAREIEKAISVTRVDAPVVVREEMVAQQINVCLGQGRLAAAEQLLGREPDFSASGPSPFERPIPANIPYPHCLLYTTALRVLVHQARAAALPRAAAQFSVGLQYAGRLLTALQERQFISLALETLLLRAQLHLALGSPGSAQADLCAALDLAEPEGYLSPFLMEGPALSGALALLLPQTPPGSPRAGFIRRILALEITQAATAQPPSAETPAAPALEWNEPLTAREQEVLAGIAAGQTYAEISGHLVVSINTIRSHVKSIYGKLGVNNRTAAIAAARQKGYL